MPIHGNCDPASRGDTFNSISYARGNGALEIHVEYYWDGVSTVDNGGCDGPIRSVTLWNKSNVDWWLHYEGRKGQPKVLKLRPGFDVTATGAQLAAYGMKTAGDMDGMLFTPEP